MENLSEFLNPRSNMYPSRSLHCPLKSVLALRSGPWVLVSVFLSLYLLILDACPLLLLDDLLDSFSLGGQDVLVSTTPFTFSYS